MGEKDIAEKQLEDYNDVFADIVNVLMFDGERIISENDLTATNTKSQFKADGSKIHQQERDVAKYWEKGGVKFALCGLENQTKVDKHMPLRVLSYDGASYKTELLDNADPFYPVITIVLYFGTERWTHYKSLLDCIEVPEELKECTNDYHINVFEIAYLTDEQVNMFTSDFRIVAEFFVNKRKDPNYVPSSTEEIRHIDAVLKLLSAITADRGYIEVLKESGGVRNMCEVADRLRRQGEITAYKKMGKSISEIAEIMMLSEEAVRNILEGLNEDLSE